MAASSAKRFEVKFWGVRGSIPSPGPNTERFGGNTSCIEVRCDDQLIILDAGTGAFALGHHLASRGDARGAFLFGHTHWDHIMGFPYFAPLVLPDAQWVLFGETKGGRTIGELLAWQSERAHAALVSTEQTRALVCESVAPGQSFSLGPAQISVGHLNHPDGAVAYRIEHGGRSIVYASDTEHDSGGADSALIKFAQGADVLIFDAMYTDEEYAGRGGDSKRGWGHSTWRAGSAIASEAQVGRLILFHHEPGHSDAMMDEIERQASNVLPGTTASRERMHFDLLR